MESPQSVQPRFAGEFRHAMDAKNRVTIPSRWRRGEIDEFFAIPHLKGGFLMVMPPAEFSRLAEKVEHDPILKPEERPKFLRQLSAKARQGTLTPDEQAALDSYERVGHLLNIMQSKARRYSRRRD